MDTTKKILQNIKNNIYLHIPSHFFWNKAIRQNYHLLMKTQWWDYEDLLTLQMKKLSNLLNFVYKYVPFYQQVFKDLRIKPNDIKKLEDLKSFPIIDKTFVNKNYADFVPKFMFPKFFPAATSGSSGQSLIFKWHPNYYYLKTAANYRYHNWAKRGWLDKNINLGAPLFNFPETKVYTKNYQTKTWNMNTTNLDDTGLERIVNLINVIRPDCISGYPSIVHLLANYLINTNKKYTNYPKSVLTTSEIIFDEMREKIESAFQAKLYDWYGMIEGCASAGQCEFGNYHINMEYSLIEFVEQNGISKIVGTNLENLSFPLIRYDTDDIGEFAGYNCPCKRGLPLIKLTAGKMQNLIKTPNGTKYMYPNYFAKILRSPIKEFQIIQNQIDSIDLFLVKKNNFTQKDLTKIKSHLGNYLGSNITLNIYYKDKIERGPRGKYRPVISNV